MSWKSPIASFTAGYKRYRVKIYDTSEAFVKAVKETGSSVAVDEDTYKGCTVQHAGLILINEEAHVGDEQLMLHTLIHEIGHAVWYAMGRHAAEHHNEVEIDNLAGVVTQILLTMRAK